MIFLLYRSSLVVLLSFNKTLIYLIKQSILSYVPNKYTIYKFSMYRNSYECSSSNLYIDATGVLSMQFIIAEECYE